MRGCLDAPKIQAFRLWALLLLFSIGSMVVVAYTADRFPGAGVELVPIATHGLQKPLFLTHGGDDSGHLFVVEQAGRIRASDHGVRREAPFLDLRDRVWTKG